MKFEDIVKNKKYVVTLGCSFSTSNDDNLVEEGHTFGDVIANYYDLKCIQLGVPAGSNQYIQKSLFEWFGKPPQRFWNSTFVVIAWTNPIRQMYWNNKKNEWFNDSSHIFQKVTDRFSSKNLIHDWSYKERKRYVQNFLNNDYSTIRYYLEQVTCAQNFLNINDIPYIMFNSLYDIQKHLLDNQHDDNFYMWNNLVDMKYYYINEDYSIFRDMVEPDNGEPNKDLWMSENDSHPNKKAHKIWGDYLIEFIKEL